MSHAAIFVANGFTKNNSRLQPWRYVYEIAKNRAKNCNVYIITDGDEEIISECWEANLNVIKTRNLSVKRQRKLKELIVSLNPGELWWSTTPRTLAFYPLLSSIDCRIIAFITCPLYTWAELIRATFAKIPYVQTKALWQQRFVPRSLFRWMLNKNFIKNVFVQSEKNLKIISGMVIDSEKVKLIPVGIDKADIEPVDNELIKILKDHHPVIMGKVTYLYFGALRPIRGFDALLMAFPDVVKRNPEAHLIVLARGATEEECDKLRLRIDMMGLSKDVTVVGSWLSRSEVWSYIEISDAAVLPFVLVPSDIPIAVLEAMARGKPVVVSTVDGLPEMANGRGVIVNPLDKKKFAEALYLLSVDHERRNMLGHAAQMYMNQYPCWDDVGRMVDLALSQKSR